MRRTAAGPLRPQKSSRKLEPRLDSQRPVEHVAIRARAAGVEAAAIVSLGEGMTPLIHAKRLGARLGATDLWVKDEGLNPTGSFKARGLSCAVSMCVELGITKVGDSIGRQRGQRDGGLRGGGGDRGAHLHAAGRAAGEFHRMHGVRARR